MLLELSVLVIAVFLGAMLQVGVGIGFSIVAGPSMMILLGTATAVPALLLLNTIVSAVATDWRAVPAELSTIKMAVLGCLTGVVAGLVVYPLLSEAFVLALTGFLLLIGVVTTLIPLHKSFGTKGFVTVNGLSGLATVWAATPGPLMVFGLIAKGFSSKEVAVLVQPIALVAYGVAFLLHSISDWQSIPFGSQLMGFAGAAVIGSLCGRAVRPYLPQTLVKSAIRVISLLACYVLLRRAFLAL
ncbi:TSUP family transporter [Ruegeria arenilitoris]|uniref:TSUP family transporter n=1 Tax=Ruegeria arenilitoris TaxID=1173585 RepID=UPI00147F7193|nr:TSUP family transporter [Ruegeria arenilitoris]